METKNELVKIKASDYGLEETKAAEIEAMFLPMLAKMTELESEYNEILKEEINPETCQRAKDLRLCYVKVRTGTADIHRKAKEFYLNGGRFVDGWKNAQLFASGEKEKNLKAIEDFHENQEKQRLENLRIERSNLLKPYTEIEPLALGHMQQEVFDNYLTGVKIAYQAKIDAEKKANDDRIAKEKAEASERELQRLENIRLKKEAEEKEAALKIEREEVRKKNEEKERLAAIERQAVEAERKTLQGKIEAERIQRENIEAEIKRQEAAKVADAKAKAAADKKARTAPDKIKLLNFMQLINDLPRPEIKSIEAANVMANANTLLVKVANYIKEEANKL